MTGFEIIHLVNVSIRFPIVTKEHRTNDGGGQLNNLAYVYIQSSDPTDNKRMYLEAVIDRQKKELSQKDILVIYATRVSKKKEKQANLESPTAIEPMTSQIPDARFEIRRETWCYVKRVLYSAKMLRST